MSSAETQQSFVERLVRQGWQFVPEHDTHQQAVPYRYSLVPDELKAFVSSFYSFCNQHENQWLLSAANYNAPHNSEEFNWNEFELMSLEAAKDDPVQTQEIRAFWDRTLPIYMRVDGDYEYAAYCCNGEHQGCYVHALEPAFEEVWVIGKSFVEFQDWLLYETAR